MKILRVDMAAKTIRSEEVNPEYQGLGGRGLTSIMVNAEVPPGCDPLGPDNKLVFAPGLLSGTSLVNTGRLSVGAKSPLTGGIKESNVGGTVAAALGRLGIAAIVLEGRAAEGELSLLAIDQEGVARLITEPEYRGMRTYALADRLLHAYGEKNGVLCIGPAGELGLKVASIQATDVDGRPCRAAGRGGLGAVMGAKGLKALMVDQRGKGPDLVVDRETFREAARTMARILAEDPYSSKAMPALGTAMLVAPINLAGAFPCYNATQGVFAGWKKISGEALAKTIRERGGKPDHMGCSQCIIRCSNEYVDKEGKFVTSSLEYETIWATGAMCGIDDLDVIARMDFLCDDIGVDTMSAGVAMAVAMDAGYRKFGDGQAAVEMIEEIAQGSEMGRLIGNGPAAVGEHFHHHRVPVAKRQSIAAYDPRAIQGMAVTYATSPMGADHTAGWVIGQNLAAMGGKLDPLAATGQVAASRMVQIATAAFDSLGLCQFAGGPINARSEGREALLKAINARLGTQLSGKDLADLGARILKAERDFNRGAGFTRQDDRLARFFYEEPLPPHNKTVLIGDEEMDQTFVS